MTPFAVGWAILEAATVAACVFGISYVVAFLAARIRNQGKERGA